MKSVQGKTRRNPQSGGRGSCKEAGDTSAKEPVGKQSECQRCGVWRSRGDNPGLPEHPYKRERIEARRPHLLIRTQNPKTIINLEVAFAWEPIVKKREAQKKAKYRELAADLANQWPGYTIQNALVVIGTLGLVIGQEMRPYADSWGKKRTRESWYKTCRLVHCTQRQGY